MTEPARKLWRLFRARVSAGEDIGHSGVMVPKSHSLGSKHAHPPILPQELTTVGLPTQIASPFLYGSKDTAVEEVR